MASGVEASRGSVVVESEKQKQKKKKKRAGEEDLLIEGHSIGGLSIAGHETCVIVPSLNLAFDIGKCPQRAISQQFLFISHGHMDHIVSSFLLISLAAPNQLHSSIFELIGHVLLIFVEF